MDSGSRHNLEPRVEVVGKANHIRGRPMPNDMKRQKVQEGGSHRLTRITRSRRLALHISVTSTISLPVFRHTLNPLIIFRVH